MGGAAILAADLGNAAAGFKQALVLVVVAIQAQQFPVAAVGRVVVVVVVAVVDGEFAQVGVGEAARTAAADPGVDLQRLLAVALIALFGGTARFGDDFVEFVSRCRPASADFCLIGRNYSGRC